MPAYDSTHFDPPARVARVSVRNPATGGVLGDVELQLDPGADVSLIPRSTVNHIGVLSIPDVRYKLVGFDGSMSSAEAVELEMIFLNRTFRGRFLLTDETRGILGRDVFNRLALLFDGPRLTWCEHGSRQV